MVAAFFNRGGMAGGRIRPSCRNITLRALASQSSGLAVGRSRHYRPGPSPRRCRLRTPQDQEDVCPLPTIYKICSASAWREAERQGVYRGSADDLSDGFIHFSTAQQLEGTAARHFVGQTGLFLIAVDAGALGDELRWEPARDGARRPHLYVHLDLAAVISVVGLLSDCDGS